MKESKDKRERHTETDVEAGTEEEPLGGIKLDDHGTKVNGLDKSRRGDPSNGLK